MKKFAIGLYAAITVTLMIWGYYQAMYVAPSDAMQGDISRIIYYHVPNASVAFVFFAVSLIGSIGYLAFRRHSPQRAQIAVAWALAGAEVGVVFCTVVLTTGPLWGRRAWGIWWTWDARLTTTLVLWLIYVSYLLLRRFAAGPQMQTLAAVARYLWRARRAYRLHVQPLVAHPASRAPSSAAPRDRAWPHRCFTHSSGTCWRGSAGESWCSSCAIKWNASTSKMLPRKQGKPSKPTSE